MQAHNLNTTSLCANQLHVHLDDGYIKPKHLAGWDTDKVVFRL